MVTNCITHLFVTHGNKLHYASTCGGEHSFSKLKGIKNELRSTRSQNRFIHLTLMSIEHELLRKLNIAEIVNKFAHAKSRVPYELCVVFPMIDSY